MKKYLLIAFLIIAGIYSYHFLAAEQAEQQIDEAIREFSGNQKNNLNVQYSDLEISPFSGDIIFGHLIVISDEYINRADRLHFDLTYWEFLNIYISGAKSVLNRKGILKLSADNLSLLQREKLREIKADTLSIQYQGNLWQTLDGLLNRGHSRDSQQVKLYASNPVFSHSGSAFGIFKFDSLKSEFQLTPKNNYFQIHSEIDLFSITWTPPETFRQRYEFFIKGFGYRADAIPFEELSMKSIYRSGTNYLSISKMDLRSDLFYSTSDGNIYIDSTSFARSKFSDFSITISDMSTPLRNFISNAEKLLGSKISMDNEEFSFGITGTIGNPQIELSDQ